jgi:hypothetical protein
MDRSEGAHQTIEQPYGSVSATATFRPGENVLDGELEVGQRRVVRVDEHQLNAVALETARNALLAAAG